MMAVRLTSLLVLLLLSGPPNLTAAAACSAADIAAAALAPAGGLNPAAALRSHSPTTLFFAALSDMAYVNDHGFVPSPRASIWPCLQSWGAEGSGAVILNSTDAAGGVSHATLFRTNHDIFLLFRGLDDPANMEPISDDLTPSPAAAYYGLGADDDQPSSIWALRGFLRAHKAIEPLYQAEIDRLVAELPAAAQPTYRIWIVGHSDGSALAQLAAPRIAQAAKYGRARLGGVFVFGPQRVGSTAFASWYNKLVGPRTIRFQYGWDPAWEMLYLPGSTPPANSTGFNGTLAAVGRGYNACPSPTAKRERLVATALGVDKLNACGDPDAFLQATTAAAAAAAAAAGETASQGAAVAAFNGPLRRLRGQQQPKQDLSSLRFLAHHMPAVFFDGLQRVLGAAVDNCTRAALQLPQCVVSTKCSAALRADPKVSGKCATCASNPECKFAWGGAAGGVCDAKSATDSGFLCYKKGEAPPGLYGGLLGLLG